MSESNYEQIKDMARLQGALVKADDETRTLTLKFPLLFYSTYEQGAAGRSVQREKDMLAKALGYDGSIDILMERAALTIDNLKANLQLATKALGDLSFECFGVFGTHAPSVDTYNKTFAILEKLRALPLKEKGAIKIKEGGE